MQRNHHLIAILGLAIALGLAAVSARSEPLPDPHSRMVSKGLMCDTTDDLEAYLAFLASGIGFSYETCGSFEPEHPILFNVTPLYWHFNGEVHALIAKLETQNGWVQYGWIDWHYADTAEINI